MSKKYWNLFFFNQTDVGIGQQPQVVRGGEIELITSFPRDPYIVRWKTRNKSRTIIKSRRGCGRKGGVVISTTSTTPFFFALIAAYAAAAAVVVARLWLGRSS